MNKRQKKKRGFRPTYFTLNGRVKIATQSHLDILKEIAEKVEAALPKTRAKKRGNNQQKKGATP